MAIKFENYVDLVNAVRDDRLNGPEDWAGQMFVPAFDQSVEYVTLCAYNYSVPGTAHLDVHISAVGEDYKPFGPSLGKASLLISELPDNLTYELRTWTFDTPISLTGGVKYAVVANCPLATTGGYCFTRKSLNTNVYASPTRNPVSNDNMATWTVWGYAQNFEIWGEDARIVFVDNLQTVTQSTAINSAAARVGSSFQALETALLTSATLQLKHGAT